MILKGEAYIFFWVGGVDCSMFSNFYNGAC